MESTVVAYFVRNIQKNVTIQDGGIFLPGLGRTRSIGGSSDVKRGAKTCL